MDKGEKVTKMCRLALSKESYFSIDFLFLWLTCHIVLFFYLKSMMWTSVFPSVFPLMHLFPRCGCSVFKETRPPPPQIVGGTQSGDLHKGFHFLVTHQITQHRLATVQRRKQETGSRVGSCGQRDFTSKHPSIDYIQQCFLIWCLAYLKRNIS